jgi:hypothetical protein
VKLAVKDLMDKQEKPEKEKDIQNESQPEEV